MVNSLLRHLLPNQEAERSKSRLDRFRKPEPGESWKDRIFVDFYRKDGFVSIFLTVSNCLEAVHERWHQAWERPSEGQISARTTGFHALIRFQSGQNPDIKPMTHEKARNGKILESPARCGAIQVAIRGSRVVCQTGIPVFKHPVGCAIEKPRTCLKPQRWTSGNSRK